ncbi:MAG: TonB-dependent receptor [Flavobacteriales bacterium]|nr:TonB-dependent receptor [Flavobacteriales bacterium]
MRAVLTCLVVFGLFAPCAAQTISLADRSSLRPIEGAVLWSVVPKATALTDAKGAVSIGAFAGSSAITIQHLSYRPVTLNYQEFIALGGVLYMDMAINQLEEVVTSASRFDEPRGDVPEQLAVLRRRDIAAIEAQTSADLLQNTGTVFVQKSQLGGGSPVIRGFEASRVLLVVDGVRMNNAIYRAGHLQDIVTVDQNALEKVEVISGPASVAYGSDALGGVIHFYTRSPRFKDAAQHAAGGDGFIRYSTTNSEKTVHAGIELSGAKVASFTSLTASDLGDLRQGSTRNPFYPDFGRRPFSVERENGVDVVKPNADPNVQVGSAYKQFDLLEKVLLRTGMNTTHQFNVQLSTSSDVPRYDRLSEYTVDPTGAYVPGSAEWYYGPQKRLLAAYTLELRRKAGFFNTARFTPSYQAVEASRHNRSWGSSKLNHRTENVRVLGFNADLEKRWGKHELRYGLECIGNTVASDAYKANIHTGEHSYLATRYPNGGSTMNTLAAYATHTMEVSPKWIISEGLRYTRVDLEATFDDEVDYQFLNGTVTQSNSALSWRAGMVYMPGSVWRLNALVSTGFRAPNVDDMGKVFDSQPGLVVVPNPGLKPETSTSFEVGVNKVIAKQVTVEAGAFCTLLNDALVIDDFTVNQQDTIDYDGTPSKVTALANKSEAYVYGANGSVVFRFDRTFTLRSSVTYTYGRIRTDSTAYPLDHIPPVFGRTALECNIKRMHGEVYALYNGWKQLSQYNLQGEDNEIYATAEGMPAWFTLNVRAAYAATKNVSIQAGLENIMDSNYRTFASGISAPGRNFTISIRAQF